MHLKITRGNIRKYKPAKTAKGVAEYECWLVIERLDGRQIGMMHLWSLTEDEAIDLKLSYRVTTE